MEPWIIITLGGAVSQTARFMLQKQLRGAGFSNAATTFARFVYSAPLVAVIALAYAQASGQALPGLPARFWGFAMAGAVAQILATVCVVALFAHRNFAVGIALKKSEVVLIALAGWLVLGDTVSLAGAAAIGLGVVGILLLSDPPGGTGPVLRRLVNRAAGLGLASGALFAVSAVGYRGASLALPHGDTALRASVSLAVITASQTLAMAAWLAWRERSQLRAVFAGWRRAAPVGLTSMAGSLCWMAAFTLQSAAYVNAVGQVELILSIAATALFFREKISAREYAGMAILAVAILTLILVL